MQRSSQNVLKMVSMARKQRLYECKKALLKHALLQNWNRHEKATGYMPPKGREVNEQFYDAHLKLFKCRFPNCQLTSKRKSNLKLKKRGKWTKTHALIAKLRFRKNAIETDI